MKCPHCNFYKWPKATKTSWVTDSRYTERDNSIRRRRECKKCGKRFTTRERIAD